jgi:pre-mRNA-splicing factor CDC5/CEF1
MDEDEKEMLSEARARLANTRGKKSKRKARGKVLDNARRLAALVKIRELKAAGIHSSRALKRKLKPGEIDLINEVPMEHGAPVGFHDTSAEKVDGIRRGRDVNERAKMFKIMSRKTPEDIEAKQRKEDMKMADKLSKFNLPAQLAKENARADPSSVHKRARLALPAPRVSEEELQDIARMQAHANESLLDQASNVAGNSDANTRILVGDYTNTAPTAQAAASVRGAHAPSRSDAIMEEAKSEVARLKMQTPLLGGATTQNLGEDGTGTGFGGATPMSADTVSMSGTSVAGSSASTYGATGGSGSVVGGGSVVTHGGGASIRGQMSVSGRSAMTTTSRMSKASTMTRRDALNLNTDSFDAIDEAAEAEQAEHELSERIRTDLRKGLKGLPAPKYDYEVSIKLPVDDDDEELDGGLGGSISGIQRMRDAAEEDAERLAQEEVQRQRELARRSQVLQRGLPRPLKVNYAVSQMAVVGIGNVDGGDVSLVEQARAEVEAEVKTLLRHDNFMFPQKSNKKKTNGGGEESDTVTEDPSWVEYDDEELHAARELVSEEVENVRAEWIEKLGGADPDEVAAKLIAQVHEEEGAELLVVPPAGMSIADARADDRAVGLVVRSDQATDEQAGRAHALKYESIKALVDAQVKQSRKYEKRVKMQTQGYQKRVEKTKANLIATHEYLETAREDLACFAMLEAQEEAALTALLEEQQEKETRLQARFAEARQRLTAQG